MCGTAWSWTRASPSVQLLAAFTAQLRERQPVVAEDVRIDGLIGVVPDADDDLAGRRVVRAGPRHDRGIEDGDVTASRTGRQPRGGAGEQERGQREPSRGRASQ